MNTITKAKLILDYSKTKDVYSDGDIENDILNIFKNENPEKKAEEILQNNPNWPMRYHLSPVRRNLLEWYEFNENASLLEIGAGCGALTGVFCDKIKNVTAVELSERRARIVAERHRKRDNLTVYAGNLNDIKLEEKFDYVTLIGVLEYAGKYTHSTNPHLDFLKNIKKYLKPQGKLILAIENRYGLKYWAGCKEDHTGRFFDSIEGYPDRNGIKTFGKKELRDLLGQSGFTNEYFYYPVPDYKLPTEIFSDDYLPTESHNLKNDTQPFFDFGQSREYLFNEKLAMDGIIQNDNFGFFSNSFLIIAE